MEAWQFGAAPEQLGWRFEVNFESAFRVVFDAKNLTCHVEILETIKLVKLQMPEIVELFEYAYHTDFS